MTDEEKIIHVLFNGLEKLLKIFPRTGASDNHIKILEESQRALTIAEEFLCIEKPKPVYGMKVKLQK